MSNVRKRSMIPVVVHIWHNCKQFFLSEALTRLSILAKVMLYTRGVQPMDHGPKLVRELRFCGPWKGPDFKECAHRPKTWKDIKRKIVCCLPSLMTTPVHLHLVCTLSRPRCSTTKRYCLERKGHLLWVVSELYNPQSLTHAGVPYRPIWLWVCIWPGSAAWLHTLLCTTVSWND